MGLSACATGGAAAKTGDDDQSHPDAGHAIDAPTGGGHMDGGHMDAPVSQGSTAKLLLTEVSLGPSGHEFIEIANPSATQTVDLATYYLCDNGNYFKLPAGTPTLTSGDFLVKFPAGATLAPHGVATVALDTAANFSTAFGAAPTYSIADATMTVVTQSSPSLTDTGEIVVLFEWDGAAPLVKDVDLMVAGAPTAANSIVSKSGYAMGASTYASDANSIPMQASAPPAGKSTKRIALDTGHQSAGGNGITSDDETSEVTTTTWDTTATYSTPTPGQVPTALLQ